MSSEPVCDGIVVGSGAAGGMAAYTLLATKGLKVLCLEARWHRLFVNNAGIQRVTVPTLRSLEQAIQDYIGAHNQNCRPLV